MGKEIETGNVLSSLCPLCMEFGLKVSVKAVFCDSNVLIIGIFSHGDWRSAFGGPYRMPTLWHVLRVADTYFLWFATPTAFATQYPLWGNALRRQVAGYLCWEGTQYRFSNEIPKGRIVLGDAPMSSLFRSFLDAIVNIGSNVCMRRVQK